MWADKLFVNQYNGLACIRWKDKTEQGQATNEAAVLLANIAWTTCMHASIIVLYWIHFPLHIKHPLHKLPTPFDVAATAAAEHASVKASCSPKDIMK